MKKIALLSTVALLATTPAFAGSVLGATDDADPDQPAAAPQGSGISPLVVGLGAAGLIGAIILLADSGSNSPGTTATMTPAN